MRALGPRIWLAVVRRGEEVDARRTYRVLTWRGLYPGIVLRHDGSSGQLEQRFTVAPGADPRQIRLRISGATRRRLTASGDLVLRLPRVGEDELARPVAYQVHGKTSRSTTCCGAAARFGFGWARTTIASR